MNRYEAFYHEVQRLLEQYVQDITETGFSLPEQRAATAYICGEIGLLEAVKAVVESSLELNYILEYCPDSIYVTDADGITLRTNTAFDEATGVPRENVLGRNVQELEKEGVFRPSVSLLVKKERRKLTVLQTSPGGSSVVTGVPLFKGSGEQKHLYRIVTNSKLLSDVNSITSYYEHHREGVPLFSGQYIAESAAMKGVLSLADSVAGVDTNVLIMGESGVGKSVLARYIHQGSPRRDRRLVEINCGAISESLLESELFGYESGAFTGANKRGKPGLIELAEGGTLFLDEIGELPMMLQVKLLHFLQNKRIIRVGGTKEIPVSARVIAASNKNLSDMVREGTFREDLFYRLYVVPIVIPPLRERPDDILPAARFFLRRFNEKYGKVYVPPVSLMNGLLNRQWKGNLRELENFIERIVVTRGENSGELPEHSVASDERGVDSDLNHALTLPEQLEELERKLVTAAYNKHQNTYKVASELGISQPSAVRKINKYIHAAAEHTL